MALHEYRCENCGEVTEILIRSSDDIPECGQCGSRNLEKLFSGFAVSMGGSRASHAVTPPPSCSSGCCGGNCGI